MSQAAIEALLRQKIGLDASAIGSNTIARAVHQRLVNCGLSVETYLRRLQTSPEELDALIENVVVPETWFFRNRESLAYLSHYVNTEWLPTNPDGVLRVLSVPCSTGEEPYSIAIALLEAGLTSRNFYIDAVDISKKSLRHAQRAVYTQHSFRGDPLGLREHYFTQTADGYQLHQSVSSIVNFIHGNLLEIQTSLGKTLYNVIFCRNLLIYFDDSAKNQSIQILDRLLTKNGLLFVGHTETAQIASPRLVSVRHPLAFAFRQVEENENNLCRRQTIFAQKPPSSREKHLSKLKLPQTTTYQPPTEKQRTNVNGQILETARILADWGQLNEATKLCETYLSQNRVSAEAYFLLGQLRQAAGNEEQAEQCFQKSIYLEPNHYEALIHLALLKEHNGDLKSATIIRQRIHRLRTKQ